MLTPTLVPLGAGADLFFWEGIFSPRTAVIVHALVIDLVAIGIVAFGVFYRRHRRADLLLAYIALNVGLFCVGILIVQQTKIGVGFGFGLFAVLSIVRLRSDLITPEEGAYYFLSLVLGLVNGMQYRDRWLIYVLNAAIVSVIVLVDNKFVMPGTKRHLVTLDVVHPDETSLRADLAARLNGKVVHLIIRQVDYVRDVTIVDVRLKPHKNKLPASQPAPAFGAHRIGSHDSHQPPPESGHSLGYPWTDPA